ncbi:PE-PGRS family protein OS=Streptomyces griseomycini OX=66895 GN=FHS37_005422 PE=4 SV=1 [Streptomyces griseomycini]
MTRFDALPRPLPDGAQDALTALREDWRLLTLEEELARERELVAMYAEALDAMTKSRDLYREAAERAHEALAAYRESAEAPGNRQQPDSRTAGSPCSS